MSTDTGSTPSFSSASFIADTKMEEETYNPDPRYSSLFDTQDTPDQITYTTEAGCDFKIIKMATLEKCVQTMLSSNFNDMYFHECFILAYTLVATPDRLLELLGILYDPVIPEGMSWDVFYKTVLTPSRLKILNFVKTWVKNALNDFTGKEELMNKLQQLLQRFNRFNPKLTKIIQKLIDTPTHERVSSFSDGNPTILNIIHIEVDTKYTGVLEFHPYEFARQITLHQNELFRRVPYKELLGNGWMKKEKEQLTPCLLQLIRSSQRLFGFVQTSIVSEKRLEYRALLIHYFLEVADEMLRLNNFEGMKAVFGALQSTPIYRLKDSWDGLTADDNIIKDKLTVLCDQEKNFYRLREVMKMAVPPCLPYIGSTLSDLVFTADGNKEAENQMINWFKVRSIGNLIKEILVKQTIPYPFKRYNVLMTYYEAVLINENQDSLYDQSLGLEMKKGEKDKVFSNDDEKKIAKSKKDATSRIKKYVKLMSKEIR